jgi:predicted metalloprotease with PDZ domain
MAHELVHSAFASLAREHLWLEEGISTYVGPIARAQAGFVSAGYVWRWFLWGMPRGLPQPGDQGLDHTHSWGRTFWGGALFCLLADLEIRARTENRKSLQTALQAILAAGGNGEAHWEIARVTAAADRATGVPVLAELYDKTKDRPVAVDLTGLWRRLGVSIADGEAVFDEAAPLAAVRNAITAPPATAR